MNQRLERRHNEKVRSTLSAALAMAGLSALLMASTAAAQPSDERGSGTMMMGPGMMGWRSMGGDNCDPRGAGLAEWRIRRLERTVQPTEAQRPALDQQLKPLQRRQRKSFQQPVPRNCRSRLWRGLKSWRNAWKPCFRRSRQCGHSTPSTRRFATYRRRVSPRRGPREWGWRRWHWPWRQSS